LEEMTLVLVVVGKNIKNVVGNRIYVEGDYL
jgi:hypothetical protein